MVEIIQHHEAVDFNKLLNEISAQHIGRDSNELRHFLMSEGEIHSFMAEAEATDRVKKAVESAVSSEKEREIIEAAHEIFILVLHSKDAANPLLMSEMNYLTSFCSKLPGSCEVFWELLDDPSSVEKVKVIIMAKHL